MSWRKEDTWISVLVIGVFLDDIVEFEHALVARLLELVTVPGESGYVG